MGSCIGVAALGRIGLRGEFSVDGGSFSFFFRPLAPAVRALRYLIDPICPGSWQQPHPMRTGWISIARSEEITTFCFSPMSIFPIG